MLRTLLIGLGRAGSGLHLPVLRRAREARPELFAGGPVVAVDPARRTAAQSGADGPTVVETLRDARRLTDPAATVVHLCTPPAVRAEVLEEVAALGYRRIIVEKPLAADRSALRQVLDVVHRYRVDVSVVSPWLHSSLTDRLSELIGDGSLGTLRKIRVTQHKPRFRRSLAGGSHSCAFEVEVPHAVGVLLRLADDAQVLSASWTDLRLGDAVAARMGTARLHLKHRNGVHSRVFSDLTSPVRQRRIVVETTGGCLVGDYPVSGDDDVARLEVFRDGPGGRTGRVARELIPDDALTRCLTRAYLRASEALPSGGRPADPTDVRGDLGIHVRTAELLDDARRSATAGSRPRGGPTANPNQEEVAGHAG